MYFFNFLHIQQINPNGVLPTITDKPLQIHKRGYPSDFLEGREEGKEGTRLSCIRSDTFLTP